MAKTNALNRRQFFSATAAVAAAPSASPNWDQIRTEFPWLKEHLWISGADYHPLSIHSLRAVEKYYAYRTYAPGEGRTRYTAEMQNQTKELFARLIGARPSEIAFVQNTTDAENIVVAGMDLAHAKGNVVIDSLHYQASKFLYRMLEKRGGLKLRVVHHREKPYWHVNPEDMEKAIDRDTKLVSLALVSNINGYLHDVKKTSQMAHAHGAIVYGDIIQGAGAIPIDVRDMGIDCAGCGAYKWLMGDMGFGFLYVREDLQDRVIRRSRYGVRQFSSPSRAQADSRGRRYFLLRRRCGGSRGAPVHSFPRDRQHPRPRQAPHRPPPEGSSPPRLSGNYPARQSHSHRELPHAGVRENRPKTSRRVW